MDGLNSFKTYFLMKKKEIKSDSESGEHLSQTIAWQGIFEGLGVILDISKNHEKQSIYDCNQNLLFCNFVNLLIAHRLQL